MVVWFNCPRPGAGTVAAQIVRVGVDAGGVEVVDLKEPDGTVWKVHDQAQAGASRPGPGYWWAQEGDR